MKTGKFLNPLILAACLLGMATLPSLAQAPGGGGGGGGRGGMGGMGFLTQDQRTKLREASQGSQTQLTALTEKLSAAQKDALTAALAKDADEKTVRAKLEAVAKIQVDMGVLRLKALKEAAITLTDEQKTQLETRPGIAYNMLLGGMGGMGGGGRRGGAGGGGGGGN
jgi:Spy/CpxP family protein refolding chaperone